ncbi:hypothetical protein ACQP1O_21040 [Nocardia sp. CA-151230]|uniref:hypothetical protein n=1 Tax=Nocardia sp. CA-151230 TaxID=3239982 RepID=UPI003D8DC094
MNIEVSTDAQRPALSTDSRKSSLEAIPASRAVLVLQGCSARLPEADPVSEPARRLARVDAGARDGAD